MTLWAQPRSGTVMFMPRLLLSHTQEAMRWGMSSFVPRKEDVPPATAFKKDTVL